MFGGYLQKRTSRKPPSALQKVYSVLWGTLMFDYDSEEESKSSMSPKLAIEILGVSEWDGKQSAYQYQHAFIIVSHTGNEYYVSAPTQQEKEDWIAQIRRCLECIFGNLDIVPFKPSKILQHRPELAKNVVCPKTHIVITSSNVQYCKSCGKGYLSIEYVQEPCTLLQISVETTEKVCTDCKNAQMCILWMKSLNYVHVMQLHELTPEVQKDINRFKASFKLRRKQSQRLDMAAKLLETGNITAEEFDELRKVDHAYRRELLHEESAKLKSAVDTFGEDMQTIIGVLMNPTVTEKGGSRSYFCILMRILEIADYGPDLIDFYFPQIIQVHLQEARQRSESSLIKIDFLQQALLVMSQKYPALGLKLAWSLLGSISDFHDKRIVQSQYAACTCLLIQLEMVVTGIVSSIADVPTCKVLSHIFKGAEHQLQELGYEIGAVFLIRRRLQEVYDDEERLRMQRVGVYVPNSSSKEITNGSNSVPTSSQLNSGAVKERTGSEEDIPVLEEEVELTCLQLLNQLGVGQANKASNGMIRHSLGNDNDNNESDSEEDILKDADLVGLSLAADEDSLNASHEKKASSKSRKSSRHKKNLQWRGFSRQLDFLDLMNGLVEQLRHIDRPKRSSALIKELTTWNEDPIHCLGWDPCTIAGEPHYRITRILTDECRVFRTKARAPSLIVCEVIRDDLISHGKYNSVDYLSHIFKHRYQPKEEKTINGALSGSTDKFIVSESGLEMKNIQHGKSSEQLDEVSEGADGVEISADGSTVYTKSVTTHKQRQVDAFKGQPGSILPLPNLTLKTKRRTSFGDKKISEGVLQATLHSLHLSRTMDYDDDSHALDGHGTTKRTPSLDQITTSNFEDVSKSLSNVDSILQSTMKTTVSDMQHRKSVAIPASFVHLTSNTHPQTTTAPPSRSSNDVTDDTTSIRTYRSSDGTIETAFSSGVETVGVGIADPITVRHIISNIGGTPNTPGSHSNPLQKTKSISSSVIPRKKSSTFLSTNRLSSNPEEIMKLAQTNPSVMASAKFAAAITAYNSTTDLLSLDMMVTRTSPNTTNAIVTSNSSGSLTSIHLKSQSNSDKSHPSTTSPKPKLEEVTAAAIQGRDDFSDQESSVYSRPDSDETFSNSSAEDRIQQQSTISQDGKKDLSIISNALLTLPQNKVASSAQKLLDNGKINDKEYEQLLLSDRQFRDEWVREEQNMARHRIENSLGETWISKKERYLGSKLEDHGGVAVSEDVEVWPAWDLRSFIVKTNDDLRQEVCCLQLMQLCKEIFHHFGLSSMLWLKPYRIISTGNTTGIVQVLNDTISLDGLKKTAGFTTLSNYFASTYQSPQRLATAKHNFVASLAAYSLFSYILLIKDRHNGNLLLDADGHIIHIDFGFLLSIAPGGSFSLETAPFKLTEEMVELMGGLESSLFGEFVLAFTKGFIALQASSEHIVGALQVLSLNSTFPCFNGKPTHVIIEKLRARFRSELRVPDAVKHCLDLITNSYGHMGTRQYDMFQYYTNNIVP